MPWNPLAFKNLRRVCIKKRKSKAYTYILQDEGESYNWDNVKNYPVKNEGKPENIKTEENVKTRQGYRGREDT